MATDLKKAAEELDGLVQVEDESWLSKIVKSLAAPGSLLRKGGVAMPSDASEGPVGHEKTEAAKEPEPKDTGGKGAKSKTEIASDAGDGGKGEGQGAAKIPEVGDGDGGDGLERDADGNLIVSGKKKQVATSDADVIPADQKKSDAKVQGGDAVSRAADATAKSEAGLEPGEYEVIDTQTLSDALNDMSGRLAKSDEAAAEARAEARETREEFRTFAENVSIIFSALAKSNGEIYKSLEQRPAALPSPGIVGVVGIGRSGEQGDKNGPTKAQIARAIEKGINDGTVSASVGGDALAILDSRGKDAALAALPSDEIRKSLGL
jgi:hypothetical protein